MCLPRSLLTGWFHAIHGQAREGVIHNTWNKLRRIDSKSQTDNARFIARKAGVVIPAAGCGLNEIAQFQWFYMRKKTAIVVYNSEDIGTGQPPIFDGTNYVLQEKGCVDYTIYVCYFPDERHYRPILNPTAVAGSRYYCKPCNISYNHLNGHHCSNRCPKCLKVPICVRDATARECPECLRDFVNITCYANHLLASVPSVCQTVQVCPHCFKTVRRTD